MAFEFKLPDIGEGVVEGEIVEWFVKEGDTVQEDQPLVSVMTDKATVDIPSPRAGKVSNLGGKPGEIVKVGAVLITLETSSEGGASAAAAPAKAAPLAAAPPAAAPAKAGDAKPQAPAPKAAAPATEAKPDPAPPVREAQAPQLAARSTVEADGDDKVLASPATRKLARETGVELADVRGTGPRGRITREDVESAGQQASRRGRMAPVPQAASERDASAPAASATKAPEAAALLPVRRDGVAGERTEDRMPLRGLRKKIAERMIQSKRSAAHFAYVDECDVSELVALRKRLKPMAEKHGVNLTYMPFIMKALVPCLREFPLLNSSLDDAASEIVLKHYYNIGVATDTERGLTVPVVKDVDRKSILEIAAEITELTDRARSGRSKLEDLQEGTFTITSTGNIGGLFATPIINYPEVAILGVPKIKQRPWVVDGKIEIREVLYLALSLDHRVVDGAVGARFMNRLIEYMTEPSRIFLELA